jgi:hypothetical protein
MGNDGLGWNRLEETGGQGLMQRNAGFSCDRGLGMCHRDLRLCHGAVGIN